MDVCEFGNKEKGGPNTIASNIQVLLRILNGYNHIQTNLREKERGGAEQIRIP